MNIEKAILNTVSYFDIFGMPLTAVQIWRYLVCDGRDKGEVTISLEDIKEALHSSVRLQDRLGTKWGFYFIKGRDDLVRKRLDRHILASRKWKITRRVAGLLQYMPFVRMIAGSGSLALYNTKQGSDLDLFVVTRKNRIWTTRLFLLLATQLTGRRRKYWNRQASDKICLNHYLSEDDLAVNPDIRSIYTAVLYYSLVPLYGRSMYLEFQKENKGWLEKYLRVLFLNKLPERYLLKPGRFFRYATKQAEALLLEPIGDVVEFLAEKGQRSMVEKHNRQKKPQAGRVVLSARELAFHPDTKAPAIVRKFSDLI